MNNLRLILQREEPVQYGIFSDPALQFFMREILWQTATIDAGWCCHALTFP